MSNLHYLFHKEYFAGINETNLSFETHNRKLTEAEMPEDAPLLPFSDDESSFSLAVRYPGLVMGLGYPHDISKEIIGASADEAIKQGFSLDYVTGLPYLPASSVKGALRSAFRGDKSAYVAELLGEMAILPGATDTQAGKLEQAIFGEWAEDAQTPLSSHRDVFFDAFPVSGGHANKLLAMDVITHHPGPLLEPNPVKMMRVRPGVTFRFRFRLTPSQINLDGSNYTITPNQKLNLFKRILLDLGVGAKTNVGYGVLEEPANVTTAASSTNVVRTAGKTPPSRAVPSSQPDGICKSCGAKTGINPKTGAYYPYCNRCNSH